MTNTRNKIITLIITIAVTITMCVPAMMLGSDAAYAKAKKPKVTKIKVYKVRKDDGDGLLKHTLVLVPYAKKIKKAKYYEFKMTYISSNPDSDMAFTEVLCKGLGGKQPVKFKTNHPSKKFLLDNNYGCSKWPKFSCKVGYKVRVHLKNGKKTKWSKWKYAKHYACDKYEW